LQLDWGQITCEKRSGSVLRYGEDPRRSLPPNTLLYGSEGKVAGSQGAAAKLGIPPSTLESKIKQLRIEKRKFSPASE